MNGNYVTLPQTFHLPNGERSVQQVCRKTDLSEALRKQARSKKGSTYTVTVTVGGSSTISQQDLNVH